MILKHLTKAKRTSSHQPLLIHICDPFVTHLDPLTELLRCVTQIEGKNGGALGMRLGKSIMEGEDLQQDAKMQTLSINT